MCDDKALAAELKNLTKAVDKNSSGIEQNNRALRGYNGTPGLVSDVTNLKEDVATMKDEVLPHMKDEILKEIKTLSEKTVLWPVLGKAGGNIITAVVTALIVTLLHSWFF